MKTTCLLPWFFCVALPVSAFAVPEIPAELNRPQNQCIPEMADKLVGKSRLTDKQIMNMTHSATIRRLGPKGIMTMDFRAERITVVIDPNTNVILKANCG